MAFRLAPDATRDAAVRWPAVNRMEQQTEGTSPPRVGLAWIAAGLFAVAALVVVPVAIDAEQLLASEDDPAVIADRALATRFDRSVAIREIEAALAANDADL